MNTLFRFIAILFTSLLLLTACQKIADQISNAEAQNEIGKELYEKFLDEEGDNDNLAVDAFKWFEKSAKQDYAPAMVNLAELYESGYGVEESPEKAMLWYKKAEKLNNHDALHILGYRDLQNEDYDNAEKRLLKSAKLGNLEAAEQLGDEYLAGNKFEKSLKNALKWYKQAAKDSNRAMAIVGKFYYFGEGVQPDYAKAQKWFKKAYEDDHSEGASGLANLYREGKGVTQSHKKAFELYQQAVDMHDHTGINHNPEARYYLAKYLLEGKVTPLSDQLGVELIMQASEKQHKAASMLLGGLYAKGKHVEQSHEYAVSNYGIAFEKGDFDAAKAIAHIYVDGDITTKNLSDYMSLANLTCLLYWAEKHDASLTIAKQFKVKLEENLSADEIKDAKETTPKSYCEPQNYHQYLIDDTGIF